MRKLKEVFRLKFELGMTHRKVAQSCGISHSTVRDYLRRAKMAGLEWPGLAELSETQLDARLFPPEAPGLRTNKRPVPDWVEVHKQLRRDGVTLMLLWQEYKEQHPRTGYGYSQFAESYRQWVCHLDVSMRQTHKVGEKLFVDYAGQTLPVIDRSTGEAHHAQIFVAVLGASQYTYCEATWTQCLEDWVGSHVRAFEFYGGCPALAVPDNLRSGVTRSHRYEPDINPTYNDMLHHYAMAVVPARVVRPQDKSLVENGVQRVEQWILARLRHRQLFSLKELNDALCPLLRALNQRPFQKLPGSRASQFEQLERPALKPLPAERYEIAYWQKARVARNSHVRVDRCYYSVPHTLVHKEIDIRLTAHTVEALHRGQRVAAHRRSDQPGSYTTVVGHLPESHRQYLSWTPQRLTEEAAEHGPHTQALMARLLEGHFHPEQGARIGLGILRMGHGVDQGRLEAACKRALHFDTASYRSIESILKHGLDRQPLVEESNDDVVSLPEHTNVRGADYYL